MTTVCAVPGCPQIRPCSVHGRRSRNGSTWQWRTIRARILERDQGVCQLCGDRATQVDHIVPRIEGGTDNDANLQALCAACNLAKGAS